MKKAKTITRTSNTRAKSRPKSHPAKGSFIGMKQCEPLDTKYKALEAKFKRLAQEKSEIEEKYSLLLSSPLMPKSQLKIKDEEISKLRAESNTNPSSAEKRITNFQQVKDQLMDALDSDTTGQRASITECIQKMVESINGINNYIPKIVGECRQNAIRETVELKSKYDAYTKDNQSLEHENKKCREIIEKQVNETKELMKIIDKMKQSNADQTDKIERLDGISKRQEIMIQMLQKGDCKAEASPIVNKENNKPTPRAHDEDEAASRVKMPEFAIQKEAQEKHKEHQGSTYKNKAESLKNQIKSLDGDIDMLKKNLMSVLSTHKP